MNLSCTCAYFSSKKLSFGLVIFSNSIHKGSKLGKEPKDFNKNGLALVFCKIYEEIKMSYEDIWAQEIADSGQGNKNRFPRKNEIQNRTGSRHIGLILHSVTLTECDLEKDPFKVIR